MKVDVNKLKIFEQLGRIPITASTMYIILLIELSEIGEFFSMISVLIWMILPTLRMFSSNVQIAKRGEE